MPNETSEGDELVLEDDNSEEGELEVSQSEQLEEELMYKPSNARLMSAKQPVNAKTEGLRTNQPIAPATNPSKTNLLTEATNSNELKGIAMDFIRL